MTRLTLFRELLARLEPSASHLGVLSEFHVSPTAHVAEKLATSLALRPTKSHLVVGVIGSGKTTTVRRAAKALQAQVQETGDKVYYVDVSRSHELDEEPLPGVLVALAGKELLRQMRASPSKSKEVKSARESLVRHAHGYTEWQQDDGWQDQEPPDCEPDDYLVPVRYRGTIRAPSEGSQLLSRLVHPMRVIRDEAGKHNQVFIFDSLDRLKTTNRFAEAVAHDIPILKKVGIGSVVVGPMRLAITPDRSVANLFDEIHVVQTANAESLDGRKFLERVLRSRADAASLPDSVIREIAIGSGGVLRDLLSIASRAVMDAYDCGRDVIAETDVATAIHAVGEAKSIGLDAASLQVLHSVAAGEPFHLSDEQSLSMVERSQVVHTEVGVWKVHPALWRFLDSASRAA